MKRPTISDVAQRAGVSISAASFALNGRPGVSDRTRQRILDAADEIGWHRNSAARALSGGTTNVIGMAIPRPATTLGVEPFFMELVSGIESVLAVSGYALMMQVVAGVDAELQVYRSWWGGHRVDGIIVVDLRGDDPRIALLEELALPAVVVGGPADVGSLPHVWADDAAAATETVGYLAALGHRRIGRIAGLPDLLHTRRRDEAFRQASATYELDSIDIVHTDYTGLEGAQATRRLLSSPGRPTAILYDNSIMAVAGMSVADEMRLSVPEDLSIIAWDDSQLCQVIRPAITALARDVTAYGARVARLLLDVVGKNGDVEQRGVQVPAPRLVPRSSTAPPRR
ncbi:LacI family DNA-binding transcriptional regulator [Lentzea flaviverrucosa]|uniref:DNA-binding transcriptional regulator, LacI/PurR family n=1 Tax=Lentzea flaviverrucosa TaxID=200379 RepID=A0A1H9IS99_9PSEU|nr:LacI family DNA-binding transcriptional regulator [Lentzea flaviverrucosa]RDI16742.1 LacI family transcriptional regulator [Lentzea flaviverrucosa]SEQ77285.1 DNA-binding transcriptional regulator, LacI/PurR family [Lentzea flaviverrucosa]